VRHESTQMELKQKEKENEFRMLNLKIKELKRTIQSTYVHKSTSNNRRARKKSTRSVNKNSKHPQRTQEKEFRPNSSRRDGLAEAVKQEIEINQKEFETPMENNTVNHGVDFGGGNDSYEEESDNDGNSIEKKRYGKSCSNLHSQNKMRKRPRMKHIELPTPITVKSTIPG
jgi:hypothetical protein